jgi:hypothetical protein
MKGFQLPKQPGVINSRRRLPAGEPVQDIRIRQFDQLLERFQFGVGQLPESGLGETAHEQIHLAGAAVLGPK